MAETRALLVTDVVDSTKLTQELGDDRMVEVWLAHDRVARDLLAAWRGQEADRTDGFLLLFDRVGDAVGFAAAFHAELRALGQRFGIAFQARIGIHWAPAILLYTSAADRARGAKPLEVEGLAKPTAARVMSVAGPGQTLLTAEARAELASPAFRLVSHGHWRMKGVAEPVEIFETGDAEAPFTPPPDGAKVYRVVRDPGSDAWMPARAVPHSLPAERDPFVGRGQDLVELARRLDAGARLVSILGIGGTGKTRLVTRFGWTWLGDWPGGVWFCDLSDARTADDIACAVARALDVPLGNDDPVVQLGHAIAGRGPCCVLLDNFEQVARFALETLGRWLDRAPDARFVVTTREVLGLPGEATIELPPLGEADAIELFATRATQARRDFALTDADRPVVARLVRLLDGLPLAIELAAARVRVMPPTTLLARMSERFKLLASPTAGRHPRQATLRGALDWSWELLSPDEQAALAQLSVFDGGFTLDAAERVLSLAEAWPVDAVQSLVDKSLVRRGAGDRFGLLVAVQEYAAERLLALGSAAGAALRHGQYYAERGRAEALEALDAHGGARRGRELDLDLDNLVTAVGRAIASGDGEVAAAAACAACAVFELRCPYDRASELAIAASGAPGAAIGAAAAQALALTGESERALATARDALALAVAAGDRRSQGMALTVIGGAHKAAGRNEEARAAFGEALRVAQDAGRRRDEGVALGNLAGLRQYEGHTDEARALFGRALAIHREVGDRRHEGLVLGRFGAIDADEGRLDEAVPLYEQALAIHREVGNRRNEGGILSNLANVHQSQGRSAAARDLFERALAIAREVGSRDFEGLVLGNLGVLHRSIRQDDEAQAAFEAALAIAREMGNRSSEGRLLGHLAILVADAGRAGEALALFEEQLAVARLVGSAVLESGALGCIGELHRGAGRPEESARVYEEALALQLRIGNRRGEAIVLGYLGVLDRGQRRLAASRTRLERALALADGLGDPRIHARFLGDLALVDLEEGRPADARARVEAGERLLRATTRPYELAMLLCTQARVDRAQGDLDAAQRAVLEAETLAEAAGRRKDPDFCKELAAARGV